MQWKIKKKRKLIYLIRSTSFDREILKPALATASILNEASTVLNELVLTKQKNQAKAETLFEGKEESLPRRFVFKSKQRYLTTSYRNIPNLYMTDSLS